MMMAPMSASTPVRLSVVIPTSGPAIFLEKVFRALRAQALLPAEVIVVDNNEAPRLGAESLAGLPSATLIHESRPGLSAARNAGLAAARSEYVAYLDDDAEPDPQWARQLVDGMSRYDAAAAGGTVELLTSEPLPAWLPEESRSLLSELLYEGADIPDLDGTRYLVGANFCVRRDAAARVGGFRLDFGRVGKVLRSCEELELCRRIRKGGGRISFLAAARVFHHIRPGRLTRRYLLSRSYWQGRSDAMLHRLHGKPPGYDPRGNGANLVALCGEIGGLIFRGRSRQFRELQIIARKLGYGIEFLAEALFR